MNKKAASALIAAAIVIVVAMVAAASLGLALTRLTLSLSPELSCTEAKISPPIIIESACYDEQSREIIFTIKREFNTPHVTGFNINIASSLENIQQWKCYSSCGCEILSQGATKIYLASASIQGKPDETQVSVSIDNCLIGTRKLKTCA